MENRFSRKQEMILLALSSFWGLTYNHFIELGIDKYKPNLSKEMKPLKETRRKLVDSAYIVDPHSNEKAIQKELLFYLTEKGARFVEQHLDKPYHKIKRPKGKLTLLTSDTHHRKQLLSCAIKLLQDTPLRS